jgi:hypothetical protein
MMTLGPEVESLVHELFDLGHKFPPPREAIWQKVIGSITPLLNDIRRVDKQAHVEHGTKISASDDDRRYVGREHILQLALTVGSSSADTSYVGSETRSEPEPNLLTKS